MGPLPIHYLTWKTDRGPKRWPREESGYKLHRDEQLLFSPCNNLTVIMLLHLSKALPGESCNQNNGVFHPKEGLAYPWGVGIPKRGWHNQREVSIPRQVGMPKLGWHTQGRLAYPGGAGIPRQVGIPKEVGIPRTMHWTYENSTWRLAAWTKYLQAPFHIDNKLVSTALFYLGFPNYDIESHILPRVPPIIN